MPEGSNNKIFERLKLRIAPHVIKILLAIVLALLTFIWNDISTDLKELKENDKELSDQLDTLRNQETMMDSVIIWTGRAKWTEIDRKFTMDSLRFENIEDEIDRLRR